jgi:hypothetical protein
MVRFVLTEDAKPAPLQSDMRVQLAFDFDQCNTDLLEDLFETLFAQLCVPEAGIHFEEDQHECGVLYPHLDPIDGDGQSFDEDGLCEWGHGVLACILMNGEGRTFTAMDGSWSLRTKGWVGGGNGGPDETDCHIILTGEALLRAAVELGSDVLMPDGGFYRPVGSTCPFWAK